MNTGRPHPGVSSRRRIWMTRLFGVGLLLLFLMSRPAWHDLQYSTAHLVAPMGVLLAVIGALGRLWCSSYAAGNKNEQLLCVGPYSLSRNPLYGFSFIGGLGIAITTETLTIPLLFALWFAIYYRQVVAGEEAHLRSSFGSDFNDYLVRAPRFWPRLSGYVEPARWEISPASFRRSLSEVIWFVVAAIALHTVHDAPTNLMPVWFVLY